MTDAARTPGRSPAIFAALNLLQGALLAGIPRFFPSGSAWIDGTLWLVGLLFFASAPALLSQRREGRWVAAAACLASFAVGLAALTGVVGSIAYLSGVYGGIGRMLAAVSAALGVLVAVAFWLLPAHELAWLRSAE